MNRPGYPDVDQNLACRSAFHMQRSAPKSSSPKLQFTSGAPSALSSHYCIVQTSSLSGGGARRAHALYNASRQDGLGSHWVLRLRTRVWPMHSATRLVPLSNTGVPVTETVVDGTRTEAVYKITARIPTSAPSPSSPRRVNHYLDDLKQALRSAENGGRTDGPRRTGAHSRNEAFATRALGVRVQTRTSK